MAKLVATDAAMKVTTDAVQVLGGYGYTRDFPAEQHPPAKPTSTNSTLQHQPDPGGATTATASSLQHRRRRHPWRPRRVLVAAAVGAPRRPPAPGAAGPLPPITWPPQAAACRRPPTCCSGGHAMPARHRLSAATSSRTTRPCQAPHHPGAGLSPHLACTRRHVIGVRAPGVCVCVCVCAPPHSTGGGHARARPLLGHRRPRRHRATPECSDNHRLCVHAPSS